MPQSEDVYAHTPQGKALREHGLQELEKQLRDKQDWVSEEEKATALEEFNRLAHQLRTLDQTLPDAS